MMKKVFCFTLKALFVLKILKFRRDLFGHIGKWRDKKAQNLCHQQLGDNHNTHNSQYLKKYT